MNSETITVNPSELLEEAKTFLKERYQDSKKAHLILDTINPSDIFWMNGDEVDGYFDSVNMFRTLSQKSERKIQYDSESDKPIWIPLKRSYWLTYEFDELNWYVDSECDTILSILIVLVHELTHAIQFAEQRDLDEKETTENEFEFVKRKDFDFFKNSRIAI